MSAMAGFLQINPTDTRGRLVARAAEIAQEVGFDAFSLQRLADDLGIRKASIFHHFKSKADLAKEIVDTVEASLSQWTSTQKGRTPEQKLHAYINLYRGMAKEGHVCPAGAFAVTWPSLPEPVQIALRQLHRRHIQFLEEVLTEGVSSGVFAPRVSIQDLAWSLPAMLQGTVQVARAAGNYVPLNRLERMVDELTGRRHAD